MVDFLDKNLHHLRSLFGSVDPCLEYLPCPPTAVKTKNGMVTVYINGKAVAGKFNPQAEGDKLASSIELKGAKNIFLYGLGLAYHLESIHKKFPDINRLTVVEANADILSSAFHHRSLAGAFNKKTTLVTGSSDEDISSKIAVILGENDDDWEVVIHQPSYRLLPNNFKKFKKMFDVLLSERRFTPTFGGQEEANLISNLAAVASACGVSRLFGILDGKPAILVGAGPSLDRNFPLLQRCQSSVFILAVDTVLKTLINNGVSPDAIVSVDPQAVSFYHYEKSDRPAKLLFLPTSNPKLVEAFKGARYLMIKKGDSRYGKAEKLLEAKGLIEAGGSVSSFGLSFLIKAGASLIGFVGLDFSFPKGMPYNKDMLEDSAETILTPMNKFDYAEQMIGRYDEYETDFVSGGEGSSHSNLLAYLKEFERTIESSRDVDFFNINSAGAIIRGAGNIASFGEAARLFSAGVDRKPSIPAIPPEKCDMELLGKLKAMFAKPPNTPKANDRLF